MTDAVLRKFVVAGLLTGLSVLNACTYWHGDLERIVDESERDFRRNVPGPFTHVSLKKLIANPSAYKYTWVRFDAIYNRTNEKTFVPFLTTFDSENYTSFGVWPSDAKLWLPEERAHDYPLLYLRKDSPSAKELLEAGRFSVVRISALIMGEYQLRPWFEVNRIEVLEPSVYTEESLADLALAKEAAEAKKPAVAIRYYESALTGVWTAALRLEIHLTLGRLYEGRGDVDSAMNHYRGALTNDPENEEALQGVERCKKALEGKAAEPAPAPAPAPQQ
jgi:tetratricopeptide (TPR) repeat protein